MAAAITTTATTLEGQLLEIAMAVQEAERDTARNPDGNNSVTGQFNSETGVFSGALTINYSTAAGTGGAVLLTADEYIDLPAS